MNKARRDAIQAEEGCRAEAARLNEKATEVANLQEALEKEKQASKEMVRKVEAEVTNLTEQILALISEARGQAVEEFKASTEMRDLNVKFSQDAFIKGFELCQEKMVKKFLELDFSFLDEASEDQARPSPTVAATAAPLPRTPSSPTPTLECPAEVLPLPQGVLLKSTIRHLRKKVHHLTKKSKEMEDKLHRLRESHSEATHFRNLHVKRIMDYSRRKANFEKELEEHKKHASDRS
ncbi:uncharacterized protein [Elaeis guineensis]|uniref:uncharacterized protein n=1 Tax=Elaeis guineensis var. tenera TaxID=51953 RepID=UPI003C6CCC1A